jgi:hypothetical protein
LDSFIEKNRVIRLNEIFKLENHATAVILAWYDSVFEGIDMWYPEDNCCQNQRLNEVIIVIKFQFKSNGIYN